MSAISGLDHVLVGVDDLEAARGKWERLGFTVTPRGRHIGWGTANYCIMFGQDYVELLGIIDAGQFVNGLDSFLAENGEGLLGLAFATDDAAAAHAGLVERGIAAEPPKQLKRLLELPEGTVTPEFELVHLGAEDTAGLRAFVCSHLTRDMVWQPQWMSHANGSESIVAIDVEVTDPEAAAFTIGRLSGRKPRREADAVCVRIGDGDCRLRFRTGSTGTARITGMSLQVPELDTVAGLMVRAGIFFTRDTFSITVEKEDSCGLDLCFTLADG